ncbi:unnamed protein product, partial [marine sediment metagenome]
MAKKTKEELHGEMQHHFDHTLAPPDAPDFNHNLLGEETRESFVTIPFLPYYLEPYEDEDEPITAMKEHFEAEGWTVAVYPDRLVISKVWDKTEIPKAKARGKARQKVREDKHKKDKQDAKDRGEEG